MFKYFKMAWEEAKKKKAEDKMKARLLNKDMDFAFLETLIQKVNENPLLKVRVTLRDGTVLDIVTTPQKKPDLYYAPVEDYIEVR